ncbi:MAG: hypothetical protein WCT12_14735 [Verrucomicrobiota bacterium]
MSNTGLLSLTVKLAPEDHSAVCAKSNRSAWVRNAISEKLEREVAQPARPRSTLGRKLLAARAEYARSGGRVLSLGKCGRKWHAGEASDETDLSRQFGPYPGGRELAHRSAGSEFGPNAAGAQ